MNKNIIKIIISLAFIIILPVLSNAFMIDRADMVNVTVTFNISYDEVLKEYTYNYTVTNKADSIQDLGGLIVEYDGENPEVLTPEGWLVLLSRKSETIAGEPYNIERRTPNDRFSVSWAGRARQAIKPGNTLTGMVMKSTSLPGVVSYYAVGDIISSHVPTDEQLALVELMKDALARGDEEELDRLEREGIAMENDDELENPELGSVYTNSKKGKTLGPVAPPADTDVAAFIDRIINHAGEASNLGWLGDDAEELTDKLAKAKEKLGRDNSDAAEILEDFLDELEEEWSDEEEEEHISNEGYYLLSYNVKYFMKEYLNVEDDDEDDDD